MIVTDIYFRDQRKLKHNTWIIETIYSKIDQLYWNLFSKKNKEDVKIVVKKSSKTTKQENERTWQENAGKVHVSSLVTRW